MRECVWRGAHDRDMRLIDVRVCVCMYMPLLTKYSKWFTCISCVCVCALFLCLHLSVSILYFVLFTFHSVCLRLLWRHSPSLIWTVLRTAWGKTEWNKQTRTTWIYSTVICAENWGRWTKWNSRAGKKKNKQKQQIRFFVVVLFFFSRVFEPHNQIFLLRVH